MHLTDSRDTFKVTKDTFQINVLLNFLFIKDECITFSMKISSTPVFNIDKKMKCFSKSSY